MKKIVVLSNVDDIIENHDIQTVNVVSEGNYSNGYKSFTEQEANQLKYRIQSILDANRKAGVFQILYTADENTDGIIEDTEKIYILFDSNSNRTLVMNSITEKTYSFGLIRNGNIAKVSSKLENYCKLWANEIQRYLANNYLDYKGATRIQASTCYNVLVSMNITASGKGVNDEIVHALKELSNNFITIMLDCTEEEKYNIITSHFE